ncbi:MAG: hypothetical protein ACRDVP_08470 [Acidimicrobiales bacterium]
MSDWVCRYLRRTADETATGDVNAKLTAIRRGGAFGLPTGDVGKMLEQIEQGCSARLEAGGNR